MDGRGWGDPQGFDRERAPPEQHMYDRGRPAPQTCRQCGQPGHFARECRQAGEGFMHERATGGSACFNCGEVGHLARNCPQKLIVCENCNKLGHTKAACRSMLACYTCGEVGHTKKDCPRQRGGHNFMDERMHGPGQPWPPGRQHGGRLRLGEPVYMHGAGGGLDQPRESYAGRREFGEEQGWLMGNGFGGPYHDAMPLRHSGEMLLERDMEYGPRGGGGGGGGLSRHDSQGRAWSHAEEARMSKESLADVISSGMQGRGPSRVSEGRERMRHSPKGWGKERLRAEGPPGSRGKGSMYGNRGFSGDQFRPDSWEPSEHLENGYPSWQGPGGKGVPNLPPQQFPPLSAPSRSMSPDRGYGGKYGGGYGSSVAVVSPRMEFRGERGAHAAHPMANGAPDWRKVREGPLWKPPPGDPGAGPANGMPMPVNGLHRGAGTHYLPHGGGTTPERERPQEGKPEWERWKEDREGGGGEAPEGWFYIDREGNLQGPFPLAQLHLWSKEGLLPLDHLVCCSGSNKWVTLEHAGSPPHSPRPPSGAEPPASARGGQAAGPPGPQRENFEHNLPADPFAADNLLEPQLLRPKQVGAAFLRGDLLPAHPGFLPPKQDAKPLQGSSVSAAEFPSNLAAPQPYSSPRDVGMEAVTPPPEKDDGQPSPSRASPAREEAEAEEGCLTEPGSVGKAEPAALDNLGSEFRESAPPPGAKGVPKEEGHGKPASVLGFGGAPSLYPVSAKRATPGALNEAELEELSPVGAGETAGSVKAEAGAGAGEELDLGFSIDKRVEQLMAGFSLVAGKEKEAVEEALRTASRLVKKEVHAPPTSEGSHAKAAAASVEVAVPLQKVKLEQAAEAGEGNGKEKEEEDIVEVVDEEGEDDGDVARCRDAVAPHAPSAPEVTEREVKPGVDAVEAGTSGRAGDEDTPDDNQWKWPLRGGDWRMVDDPNLVPPGPERLKVEPRKEVLNRGRPLCAGSKGGETESAVARVQLDPRLGPAEAEGAAAAVLLELPEWACAADDLEADDELQPDRISEGSEFDVGGGAGAGNGLSLDIPEAGGAKPLESSTPSQSSTPRSHNSAPLGPPCKPRAAQGATGAHANGTVPGRASLGGAPGWGAKGAGKTEAKGAAPLPASKIGVGGPKESAGEVVRAPAVARIVSASSLGKLEEEGIRELHPVVRRNALFLRKHGSVSMKALQDTWRHGGRAASERPRLSGGPTAGLTEAQSVSTEAPAPAAAPSTRAQSLEIAQRPPQDPAEVEEEGQAGAAAAAATAAAAAESSLEKRRSSRGKGPEGGLEAPPDVEAAARAPQMEPPGLPVDASPSVGVGVGQAAAAAAAAAAGEGEGALAKEEEEARPCDMDVEDVVHEGGAKKLRSEARPPAAKPAEAPGVCPGEAAPMELARQESSSPLAAGPPLVSVKGVPIQRPPESGLWFYYDGMGKEQGGVLLSRLQWMVSAGLLAEGSSVYRREDDLWLPVSRLPPPKTDPVPPVLRRLGFPLGYLIASMKRGGFPAPAGTRRGGGGATSRQQQHQLAAPFSHLLSSLAGNFSPLHAAGAAPAAAGGLGGGPPSLHPRDQMHSPGLQLLQNQIGGSSAGLGSPDVEERGESAGKASMGPESYAELPPLSQGPLLPDEAARPSSSAAARGKDGAARAGARTPSGTHSEGAAAMAGPSFVSYAKGKLHEGLMRTYRAKLLAATIRELLDGWLYEQEARAEEEEVEEGAIVVRRVPRKPASGLLRWDASAAALEEKQQPQLQQQQQPEEEEEEGEAVQARGLAELRRGRQVLDEESEEIEVEAFNDDDDDGGNDDALAGTSRGGSAAGEAQNRGSPSVPPTPSFPPAPSFAPPPPDEGLLRAAPRTLPPCNVSHFQPEVDVYGSEESEEDNGKLSGSAKGAQQAQSKSSVREEPAGAADARSNGFHSEGTPVAAFVEHAIDNGAAAAAPGCKRAASPPHKDDNSGGGAHAHSNAARRRRLVVDDSSDSDRDEVSRVPAPSGGAAASTQGTGASALSESRGTSLSPDSSVMNMGTNGERALSDLQQQVDQAEEEAQVAREAALARAVLAIGGGGAAAAPSGGAGAGLARGVGGGGGGGAARREDSQESGSSSLRDWTSIPPPALVNILTKLRGEVVSLAAVAKTCGAWRASVDAAKRSAKYADFSKLGARCTDQALRFLPTFGLGFPKRVCLRGCSNVTVDGVRSVLMAKPSINFVEVTGSEHIKELAPLFPKVKFHSRRTAAAAAAGTASGGKGRGAGGAAAALARAGRGGAVLERRESRDSVGLPVLKAAAGSSEEVPPVSGLGLEARAAVSEAARFKKMRLDAPSTSRVGPIPVPRRAGTPGLEGDSQDVHRHWAAGGKDAAERDSQDSRDVHLPRKRAGQQQQQLGATAAAAGGKVPTGGAARGAASSRDTQTHSGTDGGGGAVPRAAGAATPGGTLRLPLAGGPQAVAAGPAIKNSAARDHRLAIRQLLEKEIGDAIRKLWDFDKHKFFTQPMTEKGYTMRTKDPMDLSLVQRKLRDGAYSDLTSSRKGGTLGADSFYNDLCLMCRNIWAFATENSPIYKAATSIFTEAHRVRVAINASIEVAMHPQAKPASEAAAKAKGGKILPSKRTTPGGGTGVGVGLKRKEKEEDGKGARVKGGPGGAKRRREGGSMSSESEDEVDRDEDSADTRGPGGGSKKTSGNQQRNVWSESEGEESEETDLDNFDMYLQDEATSCSGEAKSEESEESEVEDNEGEGERERLDAMERARRRLWGNKMTKAAMVPPVTRQYETILEYKIVEDQERVQRKMTVELPPNYAEKARLIQEGGHQYVHLDLPIVKDASARKALDDEVIEQEVYGIDPYTHNLLLDSMPQQQQRVPPYDTDEAQHTFIEELVLPALNKEGLQYTGLGRKAPLELDLTPVIQRIVDAARATQQPALAAFAQALLDNMLSRRVDKYFAFRKGLGVVCTAHQGFPKDDFVVEFFGEVYPPWRWFEKQDGIRKVQNREGSALTEFYNIYLERPKGDGAGFDVLVVDAMHRANFASRLCHSCRPNCEAKVVAVDGKYMIGVYTLREIKPGEELTFDYNSVTESQEEYKKAVCLCGHRLCKGSYLSLAGASAFHHLMSDKHGLLERHAMLLDACCGAGGSDAAPPRVEEDELRDLRKSGFGHCLLSEIPEWAQKYAARLVRFINWEREELPRALMRHSTKQLLARSAKKQPRRKAVGAEVAAAAWGVGDPRDHEDAVNLEYARAEAEGLYFSRLQNLAITMDKVRYCLKMLYGDPKKGPPPLRCVEGAELVHRVWGGDTSVVGALLKSMAPHMSKDALLALRERVRAHNPEPHADSLRCSLLWLRDTLGGFMPTAVCRHDAAADLIHLYAHTRTFFAHHEYDSFCSPSLTILASDLGRCPLQSTEGSHLAQGEQEWSKFYDKDHIAGQLLNWFKQTMLDPGKALPAARRGCLLLPDPSSCYSKSLQQPIQRGYGSKQRTDMWNKLELKPQKWWPKAGDRDNSFWEFKNRGLYGSPMLDAIINSQALDPEMLSWLRTRHVAFVGPYDTS